MMAFTYIYPPGSPYETTYLHKSFPERHWPFEQTRHKIGSSVHNFVHPFELPISTPHADVRETLANYYVDIELPGLEDKEHISLGWTSSRTLLVHATITRPLVKEEERGVGAQSIEEIEEPAGDLKATKAGETRDAKYQSEHAVHLIVRERRVGVFERAFDFATDVNHDGVDAKLRFGLLRITVPKKEGLIKRLKEVKIAHDES